MVKRKQNSEEVMDVASKKLAVSKSKDMLLEQNTFSKSLGKSEVVYARKADDKDTFIVRNLWAGEFNAFGVKGLDVAENVFYGIITLLTSNRQILSGLKFDVGKKLEGIIDSIDTEKLLKIEMVNKKQIVRVGEEVRVDFVHGEYPQIALMNLKKNGAFYEVNAGVYLFLSAIEKLLRYLNKRFNYFEDVKVYNVKCVDNDEFF